MRLDFRRPVVWVALALSVVEIEASAADEAVQLQARLELLARILPNGPDVSNGLEGLHRSVESSARDAALRLEGLATHAEAPVVAGDAGYVPVEMTAVLRSRGRVGDSTGYGTAPWTFIERYLRRSSRVVIFERLQFKSDTDGTLRLLARMRLHFWPRQDAGGRALLLAKVSAIEALRSQQWWPLRRLAAVAYTRAEPDAFLSSLTLTATELIAEGLSPWPVSARDWWPIREMDVASLEWTRQGSCERFSLKARFPKPDPGGEEPSLDSPPKDLALLLAQPEHVCPVEQESPRRLPFVMLSGNGPLTLRARDLDLLDVVLLLHRLAGKFVVVDEDVAGRVSMDLVGVTLEQALTALTSFGLSASPPALVRHVSFGRPAAPLNLRPGKEPVVSFSFKRWALSDLLRLIEDLTGDRVLVPSGPFPQVSGFMEELPFDVTYDAVLAPAGLSLRRAPGLVYVERPGSPSAFAALPPRTGAPRRFDFANVAGDQVELSALSSTGGGVWTAWMLTPQGFLQDYKPGTRLWDGNVRSVDDKGVEIEIGITDPLSPMRTRTRRLDLPNP